MNIREEIIQYLDQPVERYSQYQLLKESLQYTNHTQYDGSNTDSMIDEWFTGVIRSLYYRPNHLVLILKGQQGIGKTSFLRNLLSMSSSVNYSENCIGAIEPLYTSLLHNIDIDSPESLRKVITLATKDDFMVMEAYTTEVYAEKRLCSYCGTTNFSRIKTIAKCLVVLELDRIDMSLYNSIDRAALWIEIFNKFRP